MRTLCLKTQLLGLKSSRVHYAHLNRSLDQLHRRRVRSVLIVTVSIALLAIGCLSPRKSHKPSASLASGGPFQEYDQVVIEKVERRWDSLIQKLGLYERSGSVTVSFGLRPDGTFENLSITMNSAGQLLGLYCIKAIEESAPFDPLPESLRLLTGSQTRTISFTFWY
jgi:hypothetical protein